MKCCGLILWLNGLSQERGIKPLGAQAFQNAVIDDAIHLRRSAENPEVLTRRTGDDGVFVIVSDLDDPVIAPEWPEEADLEFGVCLVIHHACPAADLFDRAIEAAHATGVDDINVAVFAQRIAGARGCAFTLKTLGNCRDFKPVAQIALEIDPGDRLQRRLSGRFGGAGKLIANCVPEFTHRVASQ